MAHLEGQEGDQGGAKVSLRASDVVTKDDRVDPDQFKATNATDTATEVGRGIIPQLQVDTLASGDVAPKNGLTTPGSGEKHLSDILPTVDLQMVREDRKAGGRATSFNYAMDSRSVKDSSGGLSDADRENSIFFKVETGLVDGSKIFKNASELFKSGVSTNDGRPTEVVPRQQVRRDKPVPNDGKPAQNDEPDPRQKRGMGDLGPDERKVAGEDRTVPGDRTPGQPQTDTPPGEIPKPGEVVPKPGEKPGEVPKPGEQQPPPYRFERLQVNQDGSAKVPVKDGDTMWGIARETLRHGKEPGYKPSNREIDAAVKRLIKENPQIKDPNQIRQGRDTVNIPKDMIKEIPQVTPSDGPKIKVENRGNPGASDAFREQIQKQVDQLPAGVRRLLEANGTKIVVGDKVSGVYPELKGVQPRGWPPGSTWDNADGLYSPGDKTAVVTERRVDDGKDVKNERAEGVFKHEVGHAVDHAMGNFSQTDEFKEAYDKDVANLSAADKAKLAYLLQPGNAGKSETFAEVFGAINGSSANPSETADTLRQFPNVAKLLQRKVAAM